MRFKDKILSGNRLKLKVIASAVLALFLFVLLSSPVEASSPSSKESLNSSAKNFLWEVTLDNNTVYILGSIHLARADLYPLNKKIEYAFDDSDVLVVEVNIDDIDDHVIQEKFLEKGMYAEGDTLREHISDDTFVLLSKILDGFGMKYETIMFYEPWSVAIQLEMIGFMSLGFDPQLGIDRYFLNKARGLKKIIGLETFDRQIEIFDGFNEEEQELFLLSNLMCIDILEDEAEKMFSSWSEGDFYGMERVLKRNLEEDPRLLSIYNKLFYQRNVQMSSKIESFFNEDRNYFVVIGVGHLVGKEGIIELLKERGYALRQL